MTSRGSSASANGLLPLTVSTSGRHNDIESGLSSSKSISEEEEEAVSDPFDIDNTKNVPLEILKRWRVIIFHILSQFILPLFLVQTVGWRFEAS